MDVVGIPSLAATDAAADDAAVESVLDAVLEAVAMNAEEEHWVPAIYYRQTCQKKGLEKIRLEIFKKYEVSSKGNNRDAKTKKLLSVRLGNTGRRVVTLYIDGKGYDCIVARLMASSFFGEPATPDLTADHIDTIKTNDTLDNLRWATQPQQQLNRKKFVSPAKKIPVLARNIETGETKPFESIDEAAAKLDLHSQRVSEVLHGIRESTGGFVFEIRNPEPIPGQVFLEYRDSKVFIGNKGQTRDERNGRVVTREISTYDENKPYPKIIIEGKPFQIHILVAELFVPKPPEYNDSYVVHHIDHDKRNARAENLAWISRPDNTTAAYDAGRFDNAKTKRKKIKIHGEDFDSILAAAREKRFGAYTTIWDRLNNPKNTDYIFCD